jgi:hypothetical protein
MRAFTDGPAYNPAVIRALTVAAVSYAEPAVQGFSPPAARDMPDARWNRQR